MACQEHEGTAVPVRHVTVQQLTSCRLLSIRLQESRGSPTAEESRIRHQPDEELQACFQLVISF